MTHWSQAPRPPHINIQNRRGPREMVQYTDNVRVASLRFACISLWRERFGEPVATASLGAPRTERAHPPHTHSQLLLVRLVLEIGGLRDARDLTHAGLVHLEGLDAHGIDGGVD